MCLVLLVQLFTQSEVGLYIKQNVTQFKDNLIELDMYMLHSYILKENQVEMYIGRA